MTAYRRLLRDDVRIRVNQRRSSNCLGMASEGMSYPDSA